MVISLLYDPSEKAKVLIFKFFAYLIAFNILMRSLYLSVFYNVRSVWIVYFVVDTSYINKIPYADFKKQMDSGWHLMSHLNTLQANSLPTLLGLYMLHAFYKFGTSSTKVYDSVDDQDEEDTAAFSVQDSAHAPVKLAERRSLSANAIKKYLKGELTS